MHGTTDVDGLLQTLPYDTFASWHAYFEYERREQEKLTLPQLAMTYNTSLLIACAASGSKLDPKMLMTADDFLAGKKKRNNGGRLTAAESAARARTRYGK